MLIRCNEFCNDSTWTDNKTVVLNPRQLCDPHPLRVFGLMFEDILLGADNVWVRRETMSLERRRGRASRESERVCQAENWAFTPSREAAPGRDQSGERLARETILTGPILRAMSVCANGERMHTMSQTWNQLAVVTYWAEGEGDPGYSVWGRRCGNEREETVEAGELITQDDLTSASVLFPSTNNGRWWVWHADPIFLDPEIKPTNSSTNKVKFPSFLKL